MSVANVILEPHRARLVGDTLAYRDRQPVRFNRKVRIADGVGVAFTVRGLVDLADVLEARSYKWAGFESALAFLAADLSEAPRHYFPTGAEVTVLGWRGGQAAVARLLVQARVSGTTVDRIDLVPGVYLAPTLGNQAIPAGMTSEQLLKVACLQQSIALRHGLNMCVGGDIELTEVTADGITVSKIGEYPDKSITAARIAKAGGVLEQVAA